MYQQKFWTNYIFFLVALGMAFPKLKILAFLYATRNAQYYINDLAYRIPKMSEPLIVNFCQNYFFWHFGTTFGVSFLLGRKIELEWFTFLSIIYNLVIYQIVLLSMWKTDPIRGIIFVSILQYFDGTPLLYALVDNVSAVYFSPLVFIPEKIGFYFLCTVFSYFKNGL